MRKLPFSWGFWRSMLDFSSATSTEFGTQQVYADFLRARNVRHSATVAVNVTGAITAANLAKGYVTSTSAAAVALTLPTATLLAAELGATQGTTFDFIVDNSAGANTVTVTVATGIAVATPAITGGATLTVSTANVIGHFRLYFTSATTAVLSRVA